MTSDMHEEMLRRELGGAVPGCIRERMACKVKDPGRWLTVPLAPPEEG